MNLDEELNELLRVREYINKRIRAVREELEERNAERDTNGEKFPTLFVRTGAITEYVRQFIDDGVKRIDLAEAAGVDLGTIENIYEDKTIWTNEKIAEAIFIAMSMPHVYANLTLERRTRKAPERPPSQFYEE